MGGSNSKEIEYGVWCGEAKPGESRILRHPKVQDKELMTKLEDNESINTVWSGFENSVKLHGNRNFLGTRKFIQKDTYGAYQWRTYAETYEEVLNFGKALASLKLIPEVESRQDGKFKFLGLYAKNRAEWIIADLAGHLNGATVVTFYDTLGEHTIEFILDQTKLTTIVLESKSLKKITQLKKTGHSANLENLILLDADDEKSIQEAKDAGLNVYLYPEIIDAGKKIKKEDIQFKPAKPETIATFCYTSGTTGVPKGAMISHFGIISDIASLKYTDINITESDVHLSYLPLAHIMERIVFTTCMLKSVAIGFSTGNPLKLMEDAQTLKPTIFIGVPRVFQRVYEVITSGMSKLTGLKKSFADRAVKSKLENYRKNGSLTHSIWDRLVFSKSKAALGGNVRLLLTGSAPIAADMLEFLRICFCVPILEGYGATETCAAACVTHADDNKIGHVGGPVGAVELKLVDCDSLNYKSTDKDEEGNPMPRGEICFRGNIIFNGYFNDTENTKKAIDPEGWLHTGDVGAILTTHKNALKIIDRVKNIFKLSHGEYIAPEKLENVLIKSKYVAQIFVHGDSLESFLVAVVVPKKEGIIEFLNSKGIQYKLDAIHEHFGNKELVADVLKDMEKLGRSNDFKGFEVIKKVVLSNEAFTIENDLLTPTMKLKRNEAKTKYLKEIEQMYADK
jgi:long-chain acyl-CoA synthetase